MKLIGICASTFENEGVIGTNDNRLPWKIQEEIEIFKKLTINNIVVMGRKTFESIGHPLEQRKNIVLTKSKNYLGKNVLIANSINDVFSLIKGNNKVFIIGGKEIFFLFRIYIDSWYISWIKEKYKGTIKIKWCDIIDENFQLISQMNYSKFIHCHYRRKGNEIFHN